MDQAKRFKRTIAKPFSRQPMEPERNSPDGRCVL